MYRSRIGRNVGGGSGFRNWQQNDLKAQRASSGWIAAVGNLPFRKPSVSHKTELLVLWVMTSDPRQVSVFAPTYVSLCVYSVLA